MPYYSNGQNAHFENDICLINSPFSAEGDIHHLCTAELDAMNNVWEPICSIILIHLSASCSIASRRDCFWAI